MHFYFDVLSQCPASPSIVDGPRRIYKITVHNRLRPRPIYATIISWENMKIRMAYENMSGSVGYFALMEKYDKTEVMYSSLRTLLDKIKDEFNIHLC